MKQLVPLGYTLTETVKHLQIHILISKLSTLMRIFRKNDRYVLVDMTGNKNNYLSIKLSDRKSKTIFRDLESKIINCNVNSDMILNQVERALIRIKHKHKLEFYITEIEFISSDSFSEDIYEQMTFRLLSNIISKEHPNSA